MFPQRYRLPANQIPRVLAGKQRFRSPHLTLIAAAAEPSAPFQIAILVPGRIDKRAVVRNRLRRVLREVILKHQEGLIGGNQALLLVTTKFGSQEQAGVNREVVALFSQGGLLKSP